MNTKQTIEGHGNVQVAGNLIVNVYVIQMPTASRRRAVNAGRRRKRLGSEPARRFCFFCCIFAGSGVVLSPAT